MSGANGVAINRIFRIKTNLLPQRAPTFAKASAFAKATADKTAGKQRFTEGEF